MANQIILLGWPTRKIDSLFAMHKEICIVTNHNNMKNEEIHTRIKNISTV